MRTVLRTLPAAVAGVSIIGLCLTVLAVPSASADPTVNGEFSVSGVGTNNQITQGPDGNIWVTLDSNTADIAKITPNGTVTEYDPANVTDPVGITAGPDGNLWVTQANAVARFSPADPDSAVATTINDIADPRAITSGPNGRLWTASGDKVIRIPAANPANFTSFATTGVQGARWIARGGNGQMWVADFGGQQIVSVTRGGVGTPYPTGGGPQGVARGVGRQMVYSDPGTNPQTVGRILPGGNPQKTQTPNADPFGVVLGTDKAAWFAQFASNDLGRLTPGGRYRRLTGFSPGSGPRQITSGPNRTLWVTLDNTDKIGRVRGVFLTPNTRITKSPPGVVETSEPKATVRFRFRSTIPGSNFRCKLERQGGPARAFKPCTSPKLYERGPGKYTFKVRAIADGISDPTPARRTFRIVRR